MTNWWDTHAEQWTRAIRDGAVRSRAMGTDAAIIGAISAQQPQRLIDFGCGEGWLIRQLRRVAPQCQTTGIDGSAALITQARQADPGGDYRVADYQRLAEATDPTAPNAARDPLADRLGWADMAVFNFALLDADPTRALRAAARMLAPGGVIAIQMPHPCFTHGEEGYTDGKRTESFQGFGQPGAWKPMPWTFLTLASWLDVFSTAGLRLTGMIEPPDPDGSTPLSALFLLTSHPAT